MNNYEVEIRPALARFCGWRSGEYYIKGQKASYAMPNPLHNPADAWTLQERLLETGVKVELYQHFGMIACDMFPLNQNMIHTREDTPEAALVMAAYEVVKQIQEDAPAR